MRSTLKYFLAAPTLGSILLWTIREQAVIFRDCGSARKGTRCDASTARISRRKKCFFSFYLLVVIFRLNHLLSTVFQLNCACCLPHLRSQWYFLMLGFHLVGSNKQFVHRLTGGVVIPSLAPWWFHGCHPFKAFYSASAGLWAKKKNNNNFRQSG